MLNVKTPDEALEIIRTAFGPLNRPPETVPLAAARAGEKRGFLLHTQLV